ncbi:uncharacterized protein DC041_0012108 [Schistosoma bovis]|uniref:Rab-GAP TBC domain-containing protein n=1 Tax=Schistosoma bovis TaxID=6184 RepID=A0A430Q6K5_SCHBO|nr:uncharacterized protein DC041_0012108 [Schistosoma bovis]
MYDHFVISQEIMICELFKAIKCSRIELNLLDDALLLLDDLKGASRNEIDHVCELLLEGDSFQALKNWAFTHKPTILLQLKQNIANEHYLNNSCCCSYLKKAQVSWERKMLRSLNSMCQELGIPLGRKVSRIATWFLRFYLLLKEIESYNSSMTATWGLINLPINVKNLSDLRRFYEPLHIKNPQIGVDDSLLPTFELVHEQEAKEVISFDSSERAQQFLRRGCPLGYRARLWALCLNAKVTEHDRIYYEQLKSFVAENEYMTDQLICKILLPFTRDQTVLSHFKTMLGSPPRIIIKNSKETYIYPPSGVIPFHGFSMYMLPLCYLYDDPVTLYVTFRQLYIRYFYKLHTISDENSGILCLCLLFERLLQTNEPEIFFHLKSFGAQP